MKDCTLTLQTMPQIDGTGRLCLEGNQKSVKLYNQFIGFFAHLFNFAIKAQYGEKVWYINTNSFAKSCTDPASLTNEALRRYVGQVKTQCETTAKIQKPKCPTQIPSAETPGLPPGGQLKGSLGDAFKWPSDHFPISGTIQLTDATTLRFVSYNVLKQDYLSHIVNDAQGLNGSDITSMQKDAREARICNQMVQMIHAGHDIIALQECSEGLRDKLARALPQGYKIALPDGKNNEGPCIYNANKYSIKMTHDAPYTKQGAPVHNKYINTFELALHNTGEKIRIVNTHVQVGNADVLGRSINSMDHSDMPTLVVGDMNALSGVIEQALGDGINHVCISRDMPTHINTHKKLVGYDQVHLITPPGKTSLKATASTRPDDIFGSGSDLAKELQDLHNVLLRYCQA